MLAFFALQALTDHVDSHTIPRDLHKGLLAEVGAVARQRVERGHD